jgi:excisionase family DNA binding protein
MVDISGEGRDPIAGTPRRLEVKPGFMAKDEAAAYLGIGKRDLSKLVQRHVIPYRRLSRKTWLFKVGELNQAIDRFKVAAVGE